MTKPKAPSQLKGKASKLKEEDVRRIRDLHSRGAASVKEMAGFYGVGAETIRRLLRGETWNDLKMAPTKSEAELQQESEAALQRLLAGIAAEKERIAAPDKMLAEMLETKPVAPAAESSPYSWIKK